MPQENGNKPEVFRFKKPTDKVKIMEEAEFAATAFQKRSENVDGFLMTFHILKDGEIKHYFHYANWPIGDWGQCMIATGVEARKAEMNFTSRDREK